MITGERQNHLVRLGLQAVIADMLGVQATSA
jgi:hypothetical protein